MEAFLEIPTALWLIVLSKPFLVLIEHFYSLNNTPCEPNRSDQRQYFFEKNISNDEAFIEKEIEFS